MPERLIIDHLYFNFIQNIVLIGQLLVLILIVLIWVLNILLPLDKTPPSEAKLRILIPVRLAPLRWLRKSAAIPDDLRVNRGEQGVKHHYQIHGFQEQGCYLALIPHCYHDLLIDLTIILNHPRYDFIDILICRIQHLVFGRFLEVFLAL